MPLSLGENFTAYKCVCVYKDYHIVGVCVCVCVCVCVKEEDDCFEIV
jgi:hypothetical protein